MQRVEASNARGEPRERAQQIRSGLDNDGLRSLTRRRENDECASKPAG
jgi:hypothetical protein